MSKIQIQNDAYVTYKFVSKQVTSRKPSRCKGLRHFRILFSTILFTHGFHQCSLIPLASTQIPCHFSQSASIIQGTGSGGINCSFEKSEGNSVDNKRERNKKIKMTNGIIEWYKAVITNQKTQDLRALLHSQSRAHYYNKNLYKLKEGDRNWPSHHWSQESWLWCVQKESSRMRKYRQMLNIAFG